MDPKTKLKELTSILNEVADLTYASAVLSWDQQTYMPPGGAGNRGYQLATLAKLMHIKATDPEVGEILEELQPWAAELDPDSDEARLVKVTKRRYEKLTKVPSEFMAEFTKTTSDAHLVSSCLCWKKLLIFAVSTLTFSSLTTTFMILCWMTSSRV